MKWLEVMVGGMAWTVHVVPPGHPALHDDVERVFGFTDAETCTTWISSSLSEQAREETLLHELEHALIHASGASFELANVTGSKVELEALEERIVRALTPLRHRLLKDLGMRFPTAKTTKGKK